MKKKISRIFMLSILASFFTIGLTFNQGNELKATDEDCFFSMTYGCSTGGNTKCTSCDPVVVVKGKKIDPGN